MSNQDRPQDRQQEQAITPSNSQPDTRRSAGSWPNEGGANEGGDGKSTKQKLKEDAREAKREVRAQVREKAEAGQHRIATEAGALSDAIDAAAANLDEHDRDGLARYARQMSNKLSAAAGQLEGRSVNELADDAKRLARDNPALFMLGSVAVGFALSRFFKASEKHDHRDQYGMNESRSNADGATQGNGMGEPYTMPASPYSSSNGRDTL